MTIETPNRKSVHLLDFNFGKVFRHGDCYFIKVNVSGHVPEKNDDKIFAVELESGKLHSFTEFSIVETIDFIGTVK